MSMKAEELFELMKARDRMCKSYGESCVGCPLQRQDLSDPCLCEPTNCESVGEAQKFISLVEKWDTEHPAKTRQSELMKLFPDVDCDDDAVVAICPKDFGLKPECDEYGSCVEDCCECRRKFWLAEIEE